MAEQSIEKGDQVSWKWSGARPSGEVVEVATEGEISIQSNKGNTIKRKADPEDPAVHVGRKGNDVVKRAHELDVEEKASSNGATNGASNGAKKETEKKKSEDDDEAEEETNSKKANGETSVGEKRALDVEVADKNGDKEDSKDDKEEEVEAAEEEPASKKQKTDEPAAKKGRGRPKKAAGSTEKKAPSEKKAPAKKREPKPAATADGKPRRSARNA
ncbi:hypothetical protein BT63DRAFT_475327 [Microthyrium microscopicum]|uniref:Hypervirulence associated protein TUDOR domain-containing protein n=1 Tax=Microthyrium microscopicum TaxID=703497 RepID=A0A6A6UM08_9PEZI|nr:hypothetical protein BT63DRAFT_475327 [Microthyrium microscopicum]